MQEHETGCGPMIYQAEDGKYYFDQGKYSKIPLDHVPTEYLDWVLENYLTTSNLTKLEGIHKILEYKIKRIKRTVEEQNVEAKTPDEQPSAHTNTRKVINRR